MNRLSGVGVLALVLVVVGILLAGLRTVRTEVTEPPISIPRPGDAGNAAVVISRQQSGGFSLFGLQFGEVNYSLTVQFYAEPGCYERIGTGDAWPQADGCDSAVEIEGVISGTGIAPTGESIVAVDVAVTQDCFEDIVRGDAWPPASSVCAG